MIPLNDRLQELVDSLEYPEEDRPLLAQLMSLLAELPVPPNAEEWFPEYESHKDAFLAAADDENPNLLEESFLTLYAHLHMNEGIYTPEERKQMDLAGGYWAHAGGLSPILKAAPWIKPNTVSADLGAGNGLQGLLFQSLFPHEQTIQVEISSQMVEIGNSLQDWMGVPKDRVEWIVGDVCDQVFEGIDFYYLYRPVRPDNDRGKAFYENLAEMLDWEEREVVVFSIADCLKDFVSNRFDVFYTDGHLTCFRGEAGTMEDDLLGGAM